MHQRHLRAKKRLGQHFLIDTGVQTRIAESVRAEPGQILVEIGPGMGAITGHLYARHGQRLHCVEIDPEAVAHLRAQPRFAGLNLHMADCLAFQWTDLAPSVSLVGNLPYNISSQVLLRLFHEHSAVRGAVFMLQREVADRVSSEPGSKRYGILSVLLQTYYTVEPLFHVPPAAFCPPPKVDSAVLRLTRNAREALPFHETFRGVVRAAFNQRRKVLGNSVPMLRDPLRAMGVERLRAEELRVEQYIELAARVAGESPA